MNLGRLSGGHRAYQRSDGMEHPNERRLTWGEAVDRAIPYLVVGGITINLAVLGWLCLGQITLQSQMAVILERTSTQARDAQQNAQDIKDLQRELEEMKRR